MQFTASTSAVENTLKNYPLPWLNQDAVSGGWVQSVQIDNSAVLNVQLKFGFPLSAALQLKIREFLQQPLRALPGIESVNIHIHCQVRAHAVQPGLAAIPGVKNVIAIASGKGGVGKSTTAVNLALALVRHGARTGLLDADVYGPNQPHILGAKGRPEIREDKTIIPLMAHGLQTMSIGYLVDEATPMVWRGPMISAALQQMVRDTRWDRLDYLIIDLPPGTGDIQLTLAKKVPVTGVVMVTTPQDVALLDVRKGLEMFRKVDVTVLGVIENMSTHTCPQCGHEQALFGEGGGQRLAERYELPLLGWLPLALEIREDADRGCPTVVAEPEGRLAGHYQEIALRLAARVSQLKINYSAAMPPVVVEN
jgi:ATP-binding protein involved in chromosome partitioning